MKKNNIEMSCALMLIRFLDDYVDDKPSVDQICIVLNGTIKRKDLISSLCLQLITIDEAVDLVISHVFTSFAREQSLNTGSDFKLSDARYEVKSYLESFTLK